MVDIFFQIRHLHRCQRRFKSLVAHLQAGAIDGLFERVAGEDAESMRHASLLRRLPNAARDLVHDDVVMRGIAAEQAVSYEFIETRDDNSEPKSGCVQFSGNSLLPNFLFGYVLSVSVSLW